ncbi:MAG TPA: DUF4149 domain-containing protein [Longimicrobiales bacterium]
MTLYHFNVFIHVMAALLWLGGMFFLAVVGAPVLRKLPSPELRAQMFTQIGRQFRWVGWIAITTLIITGLLNLRFRGMLSMSMLGSAELWRTPYGQALAWKLVSVTVMLIVQGIHDFIHGPAASASAPGTPEALRLRKQAAWMARINAILGIIVVMAAVKLARP